MNKKRKTPAHWIYPHDKLGKSFFLEEYMNIKRHIVVINISTLKTVQMELTAWIKLNEDLQEDEIERQLFNIKYDTKQQIRNWKNPYFQKESIIVLDTRLNIKAKRNYQFFSLEITHFIKQQMTYDKQTIINILGPFYDELIEKILIEKNQAFQITRSEVMDKRKDKVKENKLRKYEENNR